MKKVRTFKELQNHPYVREIDYEYQDAIYDGYDYIYILLMGKNGNVWIRE